MKIRHLFSRGRQAVGLWSLLLASVMGLAGCGASDGTTGSGETSELAIGLTDAPGDFASYTVDVKSITLTKASGEVVHALPLTTRVDFAQYTEMTELLTVSSVSPGLYVKAEMVLDYGDADIRVENENGDAVKVDTLVDSDGTPLDELAMAVRLEGKNSLRIVAGVPAHLTLDFDLNASNSVTFDDAGAATVTVEPFLLAELDVTKFKIHRLRGPLAAVNEAEGSFDLILRPFHRVISRDDLRRNFGLVSVTTDDATVYEIDGNSYQGSAGLAALAAMPRFTATVVRGDVKLNPRRFAAREVYAGSSVPGGSQDVVTGNVVARSGDTLTVKGATLIRSGGSVVFNDEVSVSLGGQTAVRRQLDPLGSYGIGDISVGQRVRIFGSLTDSGAGQLHMDAGATEPGFVQLRLTTLRGTVVDPTLVQISPAPAPFVVALQSIDGRGVDRFDFTGTGSDTTNDADPAFYEIDTGSLDVSALADGMPVKVRGFVTPFASAPADFSAQSVSDVAALPANLLTVWRPASTTAIADLAADGMQLDLAGSPLIHHLARAHTVVDLSGSSPRIVPPDTGSGLFWIGQGDSVQLHTTFTGFSDDLASRLAARAAVYSIAAHGLYDDAQGQMTAAWVQVRLQ